MVLKTGILVFIKFMLKNLQKIPFEDGQVQDPIPAFPGHGSKILAVLLGDRYSLGYTKIFSSLGAEMWKKLGTDGWTDRGTISIEHIFFKNEL
jgi:hypothetical protein